MSATRGRGRPRWRRAHHRGRVLDRRRCLLSRGRSAVPDTAEIVTKHHVTFSRPRRASGTKSRLGPIWHSEPVVNRTIAGASGFAAWAQSISRTAGRLDRIGSRARDSRRRRPIVTRPWTRRARPATVRMDAESCSQPDDRRDHRSRHRGQGRVNERGRGALRPTSCHTRAQLLETRCEPRVGGAVVSLDDQDLRRRAVQAARRDPAAPARQRSAASRYVRPPEYRRSLPAVPRCLPNTTGQRP